MDQVTARPRCDDSSASTNSIETSYYRARYYDSTPGRFLSEDPIGFRGGDNFYRYVYDNPVGLSDPMGLSAADVQRIKEACKRCTNGLTDAGLRMNGGSGDTTLGFVGAMIVGGINDLRSGFSQLKKQSCISQATMTKPCLEDPNPPYDGKWQFDLQPIWGGSHTVVVATDTSDPTDPLVVCDPWLNRSYTMPKPPPIRQGGGKK
jgi:RHS repeat-associated protein